MADLPNFTRGTRGKDESRSSTTEILTPKPRAVINPDYTLGHYELPRVGANYDVVTLTGRGYTPKMLILTVGSSTLSDFHLGQVRVIDPLGTAVILEFDSSVTTETGIKDPSNSDRITVGIKDLSSQEAIAGKFFNTFRNSIGQAYQRNLDVATAEIDRSSNYNIILMTTAPYIGASDIVPYMNYGAFAAATVGGSGITAITTVDGTNGDSPIQPPFSLGSKILRGSW